MKVAIKLGGSAISFEKDDFPLAIEDIRVEATKYVNVAAVSDFADNLRDLMQRRNLQVILANGAGPFGHKLVKHDVGQETVHQSVEIQNVVIAELLRDAGVPSIPVAPYEHCYSGSRPDVSALMKPFEEILAQGQVPVSFGDCAPAKKMAGYNVISADDIITMAGAEWPADRVVMFMDIQGVYTRHPKEAGAKLVREIRADQELKIDAEFLAKMQSLGIEFGLGKKADVTGGIFAKVRKLYDFTYRTGIPSQLAALKGESPLTDALSGKGTTIYKS